MANNIINYGRNLSWISFNGKRTDQFTKYPLFIQSKPNIQIPERDVEMIEIPGRSGELIFDKKRFKNIKKTYYIGCELDGYSSGDVTYIDRANEIIKWLVDTNGYAKLYESYDPNWYWLAKLEAQEVMIENVRDGALVVELMFTCKPDAKHWYINDYVEPNLSTDFRESGATRWRTIAFNDIKDISPEDYNHCVCKPIITFKINEPNELYDVPGWWHTDEDFATFHIVFKKGPVTITNIRLEFGNLDVLRSYYNNGILQYITLDLEKMICIASDDNYIDGDPTDVKNITNTIVITGEKDINFNTLTSTLQFAFLGPDYDGDLLSDMYYTYNYEDEEGQWVKADFKSRIDDNIQELYIYPRWWKKIW